MSNIPNLDLHGVKHEDVMMIVEEWAIMWDYRVLGFQGKIITGNSTKMKTLAISALKKHLFDYKILGDGSILVSGTI
jgi:hypothetical protein